MPSTATRFIAVKPTDTNQELGVQPGWYVRHACCSIWLEVVAVYSGSVLCVSRDPKKVTDYVSIGDRYSSINEFCTGQPAGRQWIAKDRTKSFYDKFSPEVDRIVRAA